MHPLLEGKMLLKKNGSWLDKVCIDGQIKKKLSKIHLIAYYFGAKWCSDCVKFTPLLKNAYEKAKQKNLSFEVVYISSDKTEREMKEFVLKSHGDWFVLFMDENDEDSDAFDYMWRFRNANRVIGLPTVIVYKSGQQGISSHNGVKDILELSEKALDKWDKNTEEFGAADENEGKKSRKEGEIIMNCCKISKFKPWVSSSPVEIFSGIKLLKKEDKDFKKVSAKAALENIDLVGFYFSANWCPPCHAFTPELKKCYEELKYQGKSFEIVFIPWDYSEENMIKYMEELHGNWYAVPFNEKIKRAINRKFAVDAIPSLQIVNKKGEKVSEQGDDDIYIKGSQAYSSWIQGNKAATDEEVSFFWGDQGNGGGEKKKCFFVSLMFVFILSSVALFVRWRSIKK